MITHDKDIAYFQLGVMREVRKVTQDKYNQVAQQEKDVMMTRRFSFLSPSVGSAQSPEEILSDLAKHKVALKAELAAIDQKMAALKVESEL